MDLMEKTLFMWLSFGIIHLPNIHCDGRRGGKQGKMIPPLPRSDEGDDRPHYTSSNDSTIIYSTEENGSDCKREERRVGSTAKAGFYWLSERSVLPRGKECVGSTRSGDFWGEGTREGDAASPKCTKEAKNSVAVPSQEKSEDR